MEVGTSQMPVCVFLLVFHCNYIPIFYSFWDITICWSKIGVFCHCCRCYAPSLIWSHCSMCSHGHGSWVMKVARVDGLPKYPIVHSFARLSVSKLVNMIFWKRMNRVRRSEVKVRRLRGHEVGGQGSGGQGQGHTMLKTDLEAWWSCHSQPV